VNVPTLASRHAISIWHAGIDAVNGERLVQKFLREKADWSAGNSLGEHRSSGKIAVIGAGKAALAMAAGFVNGLRDHSPDDLNRLVGQIHIPCDGTASSPRGELLKSYCLRVCEVRPAAINLPTAKTVEETRAARAMVDLLGPDDLLVVLLSGGGSALLAEPRPPLTLAEKLETIEYLVSNGADIEALNRVRGAISNVKLGRLIRFCRAGRILTLAISDIFGDPAHLIAGGPTCWSEGSDERAKQVANQFDPHGTRLPERVRRMLFDSPDNERCMIDRQSAPDNRFRYVVLANNQSAVDASARKAKEMGYSVMSEVVDWREDTEVAGRRLLRTLADMPPGSCLVSGGEPVMELPPAGKRGRGGRNQHLVLAAMTEALLHPPFEGDWSVLSAGTDGQDGVTAAAGACLDPSLLGTIEREGLDCRKTLQAFDSASLHERCGSQLVTGPTDTNVGDLRVVVKR
jgi:glycerate 2-kinase